MIDKKPVIILGAGGLGKVALDIFKSNKIVVYCFLDDDKELLKTEIAEVSVIGDTDNERYTKLIGKSCDVFIALENHTMRNNTIEYYVEDRKVMPVNAIHQGVNIAESVHLGYGNLLAMGVSINSFVKINNHVNIHANALVDYEAEISDYAHIGPGAIIGAGAKIGEGAFIGAGAIIVSGVTVGKGASVGAGSVVISNVKAKAKVFGNPAAEV